jgi:hypothetical protein
MVIQKLILLKYRKTSWIGGHISTIIYAFRDFIGLDANAKEISKETFYKRRK